MRQTMSGRISCVALLSALLLAPLLCPAQGGSAKGEATPHRTAGFRGQRLGGPFVDRRGPITRPVDLVWPPVIIEPPDYVTAPGANQVVPEANPVAGATYSLPAPAEALAEVKVDDCVESSPSAGYNFASQSVVSCEDSTVDIYLSFTDDGHYYFLVPGDTQIKDLGPRNDIRGIRLVKPGGWTDNHGAQLTAGHAYLVWSYTGDLYIVKVDALWEKHALFSWRWHSHLSKEDAAKFLKDHSAGPVFPR